MHYLWHSSSVLWLLSPFPCPRINIKTPSNPKTQKQRIQQLETWSHQCKHGDDTTWAKPPALWCWDFKRRQNSSGHLSSPPSHFQSLGFFPLGCVVVKMKHSWICPRTSSRFRLIWHCTEPRMAPTPRLFLVCWHYSTKFSLPANSPWTTDEIAKTWRRITWDSLATHRKRSKLIDQCRQNDELTAKLEATGRQHHESPAELRSLQKADRSLWQELESGFDGVVWGSYQGPNVAEVSIQSGFEDLYWQLTDV